MKSVGDTVFFDRSFIVGEFQSGDTALAQSALISSDDYLKLRLVLRNAEDDKVLAVLDSCILLSPTRPEPSKPAYEQTSLVSDSGHSFHVMSETADSLYLALEVVRQNASNLFELQLNESHGENLLPVLPAEEGIAFKPTSVPQEPAIATSDLRLSIHPNQLTSAAFLEAVVSTDVPTTVEGYDVLGHRVLDLYSGQPETERLRLVLDARTLVPGNYFVQVQSGSYAITRRIQIE